jgi:hypothetical protein
MATDLLAPLRLGIKVTVGVLKFEARVLEELLGLISPPQPGTDTWVPTDVRRPVEPDYAEPAPSEAPVAEAPRAPEPEPPLAAEPEPPVHLDVEPELVAEFSDPGAEEGAGAELHVNEPWDGYQQMSAADVRDRVAVAEAAELAVVQLYESSHRKRRTVLDAVERRSKALANLPR